MRKLKVKLVRLGELPFKLNFNRIKKFTSSIFEIDAEISEFNLKNTRCSKYIDTYKDNELENQIPTPEQGVDFVLAITNCVLKDDYYARRLADKKAVFTFRNTRHWLEKAHLPLENAVLKMLYEYCIIFNRETNCIRKNVDIGFLHHETRSCLFDFDDVLEDVIFSFNQPKICEECAAKWIERGTPKNMIETTRKELKRLKKTLFYRIFDIVKKHPLISMTISAIGMISINIFSSWLPHLISWLYHFICKLCK